MANKALFNSKHAGVPAADTVNEAGGKAYKFTPKHELAQLAATGCLNDTFYTKAQDQLDTVLKLAKAIDPEFVAKTAVFARQRGFMKDMPALLLAVLAVRDVELMKRVFPKVMNNGKMIRNFVQIIRSGVAGRQSLGSAPKKAIQRWFANRRDEQIFRDSVGNDPSLADVIKLSRPKPETGSTREALYGYICGRDYNFEALPQVVQDFENYKKGTSKKVPDVEFQMLTALDLGTKEWTEIAKNAPWHMTRMNLNTFARHGVFGGTRTQTAKQKEITQMIADRLRDKEEIKKARVFPYQLLAAYVNTGGDVPAKVRNALQDALEIAVENVPEIDGKVYVCTDVSGSMRSPVTGYRSGGTTAVTCVDVAALISAAILRKNPEAEVIPFEQDVVNITLNPRDSVMTNAKKLGSIGGGGTNCSAPLEKLNKENAKGDLIVYVSDNESWADSYGWGGYGWYGSLNRGTESMSEWKKFKRRNPNAKMALIDITPYGSTQAKEQTDILNIGGFSDQVFTVIADFASGRLNPEHWIGIIDQVKI